MSTPDSLSELWYVYIYNLQTQKICKKFYKGINTTDDRAERMMRCEQFKLAQLDNYLILKINSDLQIEVCYEHGDLYNAYLLAKKMEW